MNIHAEKTALTKLLLDIENPSVIQSIKEVFKNAKSSDFWDLLITSQKNEIRGASLEIEKRQVVDYEKFMKKHRDE